MIRLELGGKYWILDRKDERITIRWGGDGRAEQSHERRCASPADAETKAAELIAKQRALGFGDPAPKVDPPIAQGPRWGCELHSRDRYIELSLDGARIAENSQKFWKTGVKGHPKPRYSDYPDAATARATFDAIVNNALREHFELVISRATPLHDMRPAIPFANDPGLEADCRAHPDDPAPWNVYADWLVTHGDPRGEIAALHRADNAAGAEAIIGAHPTAFLGAGCYSVTLSRWRHGFPVAAHIDPGEKQKLATQQLLAAPLGRFLEEIRFGLMPHESIAAVLNTLGAAPWVHHVIVDGLDHEDTQISFTSYGNLAQSWNHLQHLRSLEIVAQHGKLGTIALPNLVKLVRVSGGLPVHEVAAIGAAHWPALEHLELWLGSRQYGCTVTLESLAPILDGSRFPALTHLGLCNTELGEALVAELATSRLLPRLHTLDLAMNGFGEAALTGAAFRHIEVRMTAPEHRYRAVGE